MTWHPKDVPTRITGQPMAAPDATSSKNFLRAHYFTRGGWGWCAGARGADTRHSRQGTLLRFFSESNVLLGHFSRDLTSPRVCRRAMTSW